MGGPHAEHKKVEVRSCIFYSEARIQSISQRHPSSWTLYYYDMSQNEKRRSCVLSEFTSLSSQFGLSQQKAITSV